MLREKQFRIGFIIAVLAAMVLLAGSALAAKDGWVTKDGKTFYYTNGERAKGWQKIDGETYFFNRKNGLVYTGLQKIDGARYLFAEDGAMQTGWKTTDDGTMYFDPAQDGAAATGLLKIKKFTYFFNAKGVRQTGWQTADENRFWFDPETGRAAVSCRKLIEERYYFFDENGAVKTGWQDYNGHKYYADPETGAAAVGMKEIDGDLYFFNVTGIRQSGWKTVDGDRYYFTKADGRALKDVLKKIGRFRFGFAGDGKMLTGWKTFGKYNYYFNEENGRACTSRKLIGEDYYFFDDAGRQKTGWKIIDGKKYYFKKSDGKSAIGLTRIGKYSYFFNGTGKLQTGWKNVEDADRYFMPGSLEKNTTGRMVTGMIKLDGKIYLTDSSGKKVTKSGRYNGKYVIVKDNGDILTGTGWTWYNGYKYYLEDDGYTVRTECESLVSGPYILKVNKTQCMVNVMAYDSATGSYDIPVRSFVCSPGYATPVKRCYLSDMYRWHELNGPVWGQWCTRYNTGMLFHSVYYDSYNDPDNLNIYAWNRLGTIASHGCIRLESINAKWVYEHKYSIRYVDIYESSNPGPFGKVWAVKLPSWHTWDPTDPTMHYKCEQRGCH